MINELRNYAEVIENASLTKYNTFKIGGNAKYLIMPSSINDLISVLKILAENNIKFFVLGNGSNVVLNSKFFDGAVISLRHLDGIDIKPEMNMAYSESGAM